MNYNVVIFTECGQKSGFGHITRCTALYDEVVSIGFKPLFVISSDTALGDVIKHRQYVIDNWYENWSKYLTGNPYCIIDSYIAPKDLYESICAKSKKCLFIDDINRIAYPPGVIVNPSLDSQKIKYTKLPGQVYLLGIDYIILRKEFQLTYKRVVKNNVGDVLVTLGGSDILNLTPQILTLLDKPKYSHIQKHVVLGKGYDNFEDIKYRMSSSIAFYRNIDAYEMQQLMTKCDLAITAAGQTIYELMATELPFVCVKVADNQENNIKGLLENHIIETYINAISNPISSELAFHIDRLCKFHERLKFIENINNNFNAKGAKNIVKELLKVL